MRRLEDFINGINRIALEVMPLAALLAIILACIVLAHMILTLLYYQAFLSLFEAIPC